MILIILLLFVGLFLSALFSGSETGFYRAARLRLVIDALAGNGSSRRLLWLANRPSLFVATTLVGNNLANYVVSLSVVMATHFYLPSGGTWAHLLGPIVVAPGVFVLGELLPKILFFEAPNRMLHRCSPLLFAFTWLFAPLTILLWAFSQLLRLLTRASPQEVRLSLAKRELAELLAEGHEAGILQPVQQSLAQAMLSVANQPVKNFASRSGRVVRAATTMSKSEVLRIAQQNRRTLLPIEDSQQKRKLVGFVRTVDLYLNEAHEIPEPSPLVVLHENDSIFTALHKLKLADDALGHVVSDDGSTIGFVTGRELRTALLRQG